eukprot:c37254_g1_i1 orf=82-432(+)
MFPTTLKYFRYLTSLHTLMLWEAYISVPGSVGWASKGKAHPRVNLAFSVLEIITKQTYPFAQAANLLYYSLPPIYLVTGVIRLNGLTVSRVLWFMIGRRIVIYLFCHYPCLVSGFF